MLKNYQKKELEINKIIGGIDDATKCPCIGSIFMAGVIAAEKTIKNWKKLGVRDSKLISLKKRMEFEKKIKRTAIKFKVTQINPRTIDNKSLNLNEWQMLSCLDIISEIDQEDVQSIYIDNWERSAVNFFKRMSAALIAKGSAPRENYHMVEKLVPEHFADENHIIVGAASILAKNASDRQYKRYRKKYGDFGSGSPGDPKTRLFVWKHRNNPPVIVRQSWKTFKQLSKLKNIEQDYISNRHYQKCLIREAEKSSC